MGFKTVIDVGMEILDPTVSNPTAHWLRFFVERDSDIHTVYRLCVKAPNDKESSWISMTREQARRLSRIIDAAAPELEQVAKP